MKTDEKVIGLREQSLKYLTDAAKSTATAAESRQALLEYYRLQDEANRILWEQWWHEKQSEKAA